MLAHLHGMPLNASKIAGSLGVSGQTVTRYIDLLVDLFLVRRLMPWHSNIGKRLVRSPKVYVRDSGIVHALLSITSLDDLFSHPIAGASWEGFVIDNLLSFLPVGTEYYFYGTARGAEIDLLIKTATNKLFAIEIKRPLSPKICKDVNPTHCYVVYDGSEKFSLGNNVYAISLRCLLETLLKKQ